MLEHFCDAGMSSVVVHDVSVWLSAVMGCTSVVRLSVV